MRSSRFSIPGWVAMSLMDTPSLFDYTITYLFKFLDNATWPLAFSRKFEITLYLSEIKEICIIFEGVNYKRSH